MGCGIAAAEEHGGITAKKRHIFVTAENGAPVRAVHILIISAILKSAHERLEGRGMRISARSERGLRAKKAQRKCGREKEFLHKNRLTNRNGYNIIPMFPKGKMRV